MLGYSPDMCSIATFSAANTTTWLAACSAAAHRVGAGERLGVLARRAPQQEHAVTAGGELRPQRGAPRLPRCLLHACCALMAWLMEGCTGGPRFVRCDIV
jgi:anti-sigma factor ChrR (cupin superfamily)